MGKKRKEDRLEHMGRKGAFHPNPLVENLVLEILDALGNSK